MSQWLLGLGLIVVLLLVALPPGVQAQAASAATSAGVSPSDGATFSGPSPNPFAVRTEFSLTVPKTQTVTVDVFNVLGQRVRTLYEGTLRADQTRTFVLRAGTLPNGLYLCRAQGEDFVITRRVMLVA